MIFEGLSQRLQSVLDNLTGKGVLSEKDVDKAVREVKLALLEADVDYKVVKDFTKMLKEKCIGEEITKSLTPGQQVIKIVNEQLKEIMGGENSRINFASNPPTVIMAVGLQGAGKTTTCAKLALHLKSLGRTPMLCACDVYRPAAIDQLEILADKADVKFHAERENSSAVNIAENALSEAKSLGYDILIVDTAGRLHIDESMMAELADMKKTVSPDEIMLVVDAMTGQDTVNIVKSFDEKLGVDGVILTKLDGDTRGGAALSIRTATGKPIKYMATGEKLQDLEAFYPDRIANRILGMGDVLSLIEKAQNAVDAEDARKLNQKLKKNDFDFEDFLAQLRQMKKMGPLKNIMEMIPGLSKTKQLKDMDIDEKQLSKVEAVVLSMTKQERANPDIINASRKRRIAAGSGTNVSDVNRLLKQFKEMKKMIKMFTGGGGKKRRRNPFPFMGF